MALASYSELVLAAINVAPTLHTIVIGAVHVRVSESTTGYTFTPCVGWIFFNFPGIDILFVSHPKDMYVMMTMDGYLSKYIKREGFSI